MLLAGTAILGTDTLTLTATGWTLTKSVSEVGAGGAAAGRFAAFTAFAPNTTVATFTVSTNQVHAFTFITSLIDEWAGTHLTTPVDNSNKAITSGSQTVSLTPVAANCAVLGMCCDSITAVGTIGGVAASKGADDASGDWSTYRILTGGAGSAVAVTPTGSGTGLIIAMSIQPPGSTFLFQDDEEMQKLRYPLIGVSSY